MTKEGNGIGMAVIYRSPPECCRGRGAEKSNIQPCYILSSVSRTEGSDAEHHLSVIRWCFTLSPSCCRPITGRIPGFA